MTNSRLTAAIYLVSVFMAACTTGIPVVQMEEKDSMPLQTGKGDADVVYVKAVQSTDGSWTFYVTVSHPDTDWENYADGWDIVTLDGTVLKPNPESLFTRLLVHPHVDEQPFTRSQTNITIPAGVSRVIVRAHDLVDGFGGKEVLVDMTQVTGENFEIEPSPK